MTDLIPAKALDSHIAILGKTGSGKSNAAKVIAERLMAAGERVCAIDPTGTWWGIRLKPSGKPSTFKPVIFGGQHADIPITDQHGALIAEAIGTSSDSAVIDTRLMTVGQRTRFFAAFGEGLLRLNRGPLTLIIDEAHLFAPQGRVNDPQSGAMLHAANNLVSLGRGIGLKIILISQRPAKLHKDALTQVETMIAMRLIAPQDRNAVNDWVGEWADPGQGKEIVSSLPSLPVGDAWVWSPQIDHLKRIHFPLAATFDSGKAPSRDEAAPVLAPINVTAFGAKLDAIRQEAEANDPVKLKRRIAELERAEAKPAATVEVVDANHPEVRSLIDAARAEGHQQGFDAGQAAATVAAHAKVLAFAQEFQIERAPAHVAQSRPMPTAKAAPSRPATRSTAPTPMGEFTGPQTKILRSLSMWAALGHAEPSKVMVAVVAGYRASSGGYANLLGQLRAAGAIDYPQPGHVRLLSAAGSMSAEEGRDLLLSTLSGPQRKLFDALLAHGEMSKAELAEGTSYSPTSGGFANLLGQLRSMGIVDYPAAGRVALVEWVFEIMGPGK